MISKGEKPYYEITAREQTEAVAPEDAAKLIFQKMKGRLQKMHRHNDHNMEINSELFLYPLTETAQSALGSDITEGVITVPFEFAHAQKQALRLAPLLTNKTFYLFFL